MNIIERFLNQSKEFQWVIIWGIGSLSVWLLTAFYTTNRNRQKEKYFNLQKVSEEIIQELRQREDTLVIYEEEKDYLNSIYKDMTEDIWENGDKLAYQEYKFTYDTVKKLAEKQQKSYNNFLSLIKIYFSEYGLTEVRDKSIELNKLVILYQVENTNNREGKMFIAKEIRDICVNIEELIIIKMKRLWRPRYKNLLYRFIEKYNK